MSDRSEASDPKLPHKLVVMAVAMFGFGYLLVPIYDVFCDITGLNGRTSDRAVSELRYAPDQSRSVQVEFITAVNAGAAWEFRAEESSMRVHPGELYVARFYAENLRDIATVAQAVPSVAPGVAARYFQKTDCFCFDQQPFAAGEGRMLEVRFIIDPDLPPEVETVSLGYTFFDLQTVAGAAPVPDTRG